MAEPISLSAVTAEQQAWEFLNRFRALVAQFRADNPTADLRRLRVRHSIDRGLRARFSITLPLDETILANGGTTWTAADVLTAGAGPLTFGEHGDPLTIDGVVIEF